MSTRELCIFAGMCLVWGFHYVVLKTGVTELPPLLYAALRMSVVALFMAPFLRWRPGMMGRVLTAGICLGALNYAFLFNGVKHAPASAAAIAIELYVPFATILSVIFLGEKVGWRRIAGISFAFCGVALVALARDAGSEGDRIGVGVALVACCALVESVGAILVKQAKGFRPQELLAWFAVIGAGFLWGATLVADGPPGPHFAEARPHIVAMTVLYSAIGASIFGHTAYYWLLQRLPVSQVAVSTLLTTLLGVGFSVVFLGERLTTQFLIGGAMVVAGVGFVLLRAAKKKSETLGAGAPEADVPPAIVVGAAVKEP